MNKKRYNLNWHTYADHLMEMLHKMMKSDELTDVTLVCDDQKQFKAHKIVLSACSTVFKNIIESLPSSSSVIYLRGIQHHEMESILEFMYLGVATFYQERMNEFLNVAKILEIKEIGKDVELNDNEETNNDHDESDTDKFDEQVDAGDINNFVSDQFINTTGRQDINSTSSRYRNRNKLADNSNRNLSCDKCNAQFANQYNLQRHIKSIHEGLKFSCDQCDYQASHQSNLTTHIKSVHEGVRFLCNQCDYQASQQANLTTHIKSKHEGLKFACNECDYQASNQSNLTAHIKSKHEGVKFPCEHCRKEFCFQQDLNRHIKKSCKQRR